ncbi:hypothetical protein P692DRAFT_20870582, partial [Suillus brevipes Sb2]
MDLMDSLSGPTPFRCTCNREFTQESAYTKHQRSCTKGKKRLFSALSRAKDLLGSTKRSRLDKSKSIDRQSSSTQFHHSSVPPSFSGEVNETLGTETSGACSSLLSSSHPTQVASCADSSSRIPPASTSQAVLGTEHMEIDEEGLSLAQRRSRRVGIGMPRRYRQYDDVLPQPPPSVPPSRIAQQPVSDPLAHSTDAARTSPQAPPFRTARNIFGLIRQFFSSIPPSHDPEDVITLKDISTSTIPAMAPAKLDVPTEPRDNSFHPYPNRSSFELGHWYWNGSVQKSHQSFRELIDIVGRPDFDSDDVRSMQWDKINSRLGASTQDEEGDEWEDEDAGWNKTQVTITVPFSRTTAQPGARPYVAAELYHRSLVSVIREKLSNAQDDELFHYEPYELRWSAPHLQHEVNIQGELYTSPAFMDAHRKLQESPGEPGCELPRVVVAL